INSTLIVESQGAYGSGGPGVPGAAGPSPGFAEVRVGTLKCRKSFRDVVLPGEVFFVHQRPQQAESPRRDAQARSEISRHALGRFRILAIEIRKPQAGPAHARSFRVSQRPYQAIKH